MNQMGHNMAPSAPSAPSAPPSTSVPEVSIEMENLSNYDTRGSENSAALPPSYDEAIQQSPSK